MLGYMLTWTTYGTWLQGDERGYVKDGQILEANEALHKANTEAQKDATVKLSKESRQVVKDAILKEAKELGQEIHAISVRSTHVHIVGSWVDEKIEKVAGRYKKAATDALRENGFAGTVWTKGFDKRYCFSEKDLQQRINYVERHNK